MKDAALNAVGCLILAVGTALAAIILLVAWQLHDRYPSIQHAVLVFFALSHFYGAATLLVGGCLPDRVAYQQPNMLEMLHRSRYLLFDCLALPCLLWMIAETVHLSKDVPLLGYFSELLEEPWKIPTICVLIVIHAAVAGLAAMDCGKYPFTHSNCLGVLYWRPVRFTPRMQRPWVLVTRALWVLAVWMCLCRFRIGLLIAAGGFHLAFYGHMAPFTRPDEGSWEIFAQPLATAVLHASMLHAMQVSLQCNWRHWDPSRCVVVSSHGAVPLLRGFTGLTSLRF